LGNGTIELTARAAVQIRGLPAGAAEPCAALLAPAGLLPSPDHDRVRNIQASPVAGRHPAARAGIDDVVADLDRRICADPALTALSGRFLFAVDDGSGLHGDRPANVLLVAHDAARFRLHVGGEPTADALPWADAARAAVAAAAGAPGPGAAPTSVRSLALGPLRQRDGRVAVTAMPRLARLDPPTVQGLAALARAHHTDVRVSAQRALTLVDIAEDDAPEVVRSLAGLGLVTDPASGWYGLTACAGLGACALARRDVRAEAADRARLRTAQSPREHWSACERRCGRPAGAHAAFTAAADGRLQVEQDSAR
jgi:sulfite reductase beta subunit-like hemoprotein